MILCLALLTVSAQAGKPWDNGKLRVSDNQRYLQFENGQPFFWLRLQHCYWLHLLYGAFWVV